MIIQPSNKIWQQIYPNLRDAWSDSDEYWHGIRHFETWLLKQGITVYRDDNRTEGRLWRDIELPDGEELIALIIKWS
jgi:hypothetical protein